LSELTPALAGAPSRDDALAAVAASLGALEGAAREVVESQGFAYTVSVSVAREAFPTRDYETFSLPAGEYDALRVELGAAAGRNWWCVVFPPLCVGDSSAAREALSEDEWALITEEDGVPAVKFRVIELWAKLRGWLRR
jgi:stage II sporulation protein R